jgi:hypothetical protein
MKHLLWPILILAPMMATAQQPSLEAKIAMLDAKRQLANDSAEVKRSRNALNAAAARCTGSSTALADQAVFIQKEVASTGTAITITEVLEAVDAVLVDYPGKQDCLSPLAQYATLRKAGAHHALAVVQMRAAHKVVAQQSARK